MQTIYIPIGLPGCGKTTLYDIHLKGKGVIRISADDIRFKLLDSEKTRKYFDYTIEKLVWTMYHQRFQTLLETNCSIYCDCTNITRTKRTMLYEVIKQSKRTVKIIYLIFGFHADQCWQNQQTRERKVSLEILQQMEKTMEFVYPIKQFPFIEQGILYYIDDLDEIPRIIDHISNKL